MNSFVVIDLETTGFAAFKDEIIEIGAWKVKDGAVVDKFCTLVRPHIYVPVSIQNLTGITMDDLADCEPIESVLPEFHTWCEDLPFLGHSLQFDYGFLCAKGKPLGVDFTNNGRRTGIDTLSLSKKLLKLSNNKLCTVVDYFKIPISADKGGFHRGGYDAYMTKLVYDRFKYLYGNVLSVTTPELLDKTNKDYGEASIVDVLDFE